MILHSSQLSRISILIITLLVLTNCASLVRAGLTYILLKGTGSSCLSVDPLPGSTLEIKYHLPDLKIKDDFNEEKLSEETLNTEGMDEGEAALLKRQREVAIKRARQGKDVSIAISQRTPFSTGQPLVSNRLDKETDAEANASASSEDQQQLQQQQLQQLQQQQAAARERPRNIREQPTEKEGTVTFETSSLGGPVQICVHSLFANKMGPYQVGLEVNQQVDLSDQQVNVVMMAGSNSGKRLLETEEELKKATAHLSNFGKELVRAEQLVRTILASADVVKKEEAEFYEHSIRMEKSVHFWPMLQLTCLVVAAIVQIRHVLHWMKAKHIV